MPFNWIDICIASVSLFFPPVVVWRAHGFGIDFLKSIIVTYLGYLPGELLIIMFSTRFTIIILLIMLRRYVLVTFDDGCIFPMAIPYEDVI